MTELCVASAIVGAECVLKLSGDIDLCCADQIGELGVGTLDSHRIDRLTLDMSAVTFIDSYGLQALVRLQQTAAARGKIFAVRNPAEAVLLVLHLTALDTVLAIDTGGEVPPPLSQQIVRNRNLHV